MSHSKKIRKALAMSEPIINSIEFDDIDHSDCPDFCDAFISYAEINGRPMTDIELDRLNNDRDFVHGKLMEYIF